MKIALIALHFAEYSLALAKALSKSHDVLLILGKNNFEMEIGGDISRFCSTKLHVNAVPHTRNPLGVPSRALAIAMQIRKFRPDIIHCQEDTKDYLFLALPLLRKVPFVLTVHDPKPHSGLDARRKARSRHGIYSRQLRRRADGVIVHGDSLVSVARQAIPNVGRKVFAIPHGPLGEVFGPDRSLAWVPGNCLFFGRVEAYKGLPDFIEAIRILRMRGVQAKGIIAGRGSELDRLKPTLLGDEGFTVIDRFLSPTEVLQCFAEANVVVMPYKDATQSGVAAYALGLGRAIVATDVGAIPDVVRHEVTGLLVPPNDPVAVASAIGRILGDQSLAMKLANGALALGQTECSWSAIAQQTIDAYEAVLTPGLSTANDLAIDASVSNPG